MQPPEAPRVFISYSHDSPEHEQRVFDLADRLRADGVDCEVDQFEEAPPEGWYQWMMRQIHDAKYVLIVCTKPYRRRVTGEEHPDLGRGARWEGALITQALYDGGGKNSKFIPVVLQDADLSEVPVFLRSTTHYLVDDDRGYERLYRRLTSQQRVVKRELGTVRRLEPEHAPDSLVGMRDSGGVVRAPEHESLADQSHPPTGSRSTGPALPIVLLREANGRMHFIPLVFVRMESEVTLVMRPGSSSDRTFLESLVASRFGYPTIDVAFGLTAFRARITAVVRSIENEDDRFTLSLAMEPDAQRHFPEMTTEGFSADEIASLRARRILLDEHLPEPASRSRGWNQESLLEGLVKGFNSPISVEKSPLPDLYRETGADRPSRFIEPAKLVAAMWLLMTGTVEHVLDLEMYVSSPGVLTVHFRGERARVYTNKEPEIIEVDGTCMLG